MPSDGSYYVGRANVVKTIAVVLLTYNRIEYAQITLAALIKNLRYSGPLALHVADDGSPRGYLDRMMKWATTSKGSPFGDVSSSVSLRGGYGKNYNLATQSVHEFADYVLCCEDDWELLRPLNLDPLVEDIQTLDDDACIRLGYIGWTQELRGSFLGINGRTYLRLHSDSPEPHVWAGHPRIESKSWQRNVGPWPEGLEPGATEFEVAHIPAARERVYWPADEIHPRGDCFAHIGAVQAGSL